MFSCPPSMNKNKEVTNFCDKSRHLFLWQTNRTGLKLLKNLMPKNVWTLYFQQICTLTKQNIVFQVNSQKYLVIFCVNWCKSSLSKINLYRNDLWSPNYGWEDLQWGWSICQMEEIVCYSFTCCCWQWWIESLPVFLRQDFVCKYKKRYGHDSTAPCCQKWPFKCVWIHFGSYWKQISSWQIWRLTTSFPASMGHLDVCKYIMENTEEECPRDNKGQHPLHWAAMKGHSDLCKYMITKMKNKSQNAMWALHHCTGLLTTAN